jgi:hypothetical protein
MPLKEPAEERRESGDLDMMDGGLFVFWGFLGYFLLLSFAVDCVVHGKCELLDGVAWLFLFCSGASRACPHRASHREGLVPPFPTRALHPPCPTGSPPSRGPAAYLDQVRWSERLVLTFVSWEVQEVIERCPTFYEPNEREVATTLASLIASRRFGLVQKCLCSQAQQY